MSDLIRNNRDYLSVTGEYPIITATTLPEPADPTVWARPVTGPKQFYIESEDGAMAVGASDLGNVPDDVTSEQLVAMGFVHCTDPDAIRAVVSMFHLFYPIEAGGTQ